MDWKVISRPAFSVAAVKRSFNETTLSVGVREFFKEYKGSELAKAFYPRLGVCMSPEVEGDWVYAIGDEYHAGMLCPSPFELINLPAQDWAVFSGAPASELRRFIYGEWFVSGGYEILTGSDIEYYDREGEISEIHIPVKKRS